ncbi:SufS family cysteine desulfurase [Neptunomonas sp. XY-337]|uniref:SufS family cysteine desulfurase n=1 Tax=Neptunomonas sp. XY-337 TaxID=2561897 RepID=UPI00145A66C9|nr:SufS family cysteine desulfurase [Neptunomonas sp. XY-337]
MLDIKRLRRDFPILSSRVHGRSLVYFDNAATTQKPKAVIDALTRYYKTTNANVHRGSHSLSNRATAQFEAARETVAAFINATASHEVIWTRGTTEGMNLVAQTLGPYALNKDDTVLVTTMEHHANIVPWQQLCQRVGAKLIPVPLRGDQTLDLKAYEALLDEHTPKIVSLCHVSNALGVINPIETCIALAKQRGAYTVIDGAQAVAHLRVDVQKLDCDFYLFSGHKCFGPTGIGVVWGRSALLESLEPWQFGGEMIKTVSFSGSTFNDLPFKFEAGTPPISEAIALATALDYLTNQDREALHQHEQDLRAQAVALLQDMDGITIYAPNSENAGVLSFNVAGLHHQDLALMLDEAGIAVRSGHHCTMPLMESLGIDGTVRASFSIYNTVDEVRYFANTLIEIVTQLRELPSEAGTEKAAFTWPQMQHSAAQAQHIFSTLPNWQQRLNTLIEWANLLPVLPDDFIVYKNRVSGCESAVWLVADTHDQHACQFALYSDARIMRGLCYLLLTQVQAQPSEQIRKFDVPALLAACQLDLFLSPSRTNGVIAIAHAIKQHVAAKRGLE